MRDYLILFFSLVMILFVTYLTSCTKSTDQPAAHPDSTWGEFIGPIHTKWVQHGREMVVLEDTTYVDPKGVRWIAPKGSEINGASIPKALWSITGGPYDGDYRWASVYHDVACRQKTAAWEDVHRMFYNALRANGMDERQAKFWYAGVYRFGPRWPDPKSRITIPATPTQQMSEADIKELKEFAEKNPSLEAIETDETLPGKAKPQ